MSTRLNYLFTPGKITTLLDGAYGSSGKGKVASTIAEHSDNWTFCCNTFAPQAGHWVRFRDGRQFFYQTLNSCAYAHAKFEKMYIGPGAMIELPAFWKEVEANGIPRSKIGISPCVAILQDMDSAYERGEVDLDGNPSKTSGGGTHKKGSTCLHRNSVIQTEDGVMTIRDIVDNKYSGKVLSLDANGKFVFKKVIGHQRLKNDDGKRWVTFGGNNRSKLVCTEDHRCASISNILRPEIKYLEAKDLGGNFVVKMVNEVNQHKENPLYNDLQMSAMIGSMFGDGSIHKNSFSSEHGHKQKEYCEYKQKIFGGLITAFRSGWNKENPSFRLATPINAQTTYLRGLFYGDGGKTIEKALPYLNEIGLAFWYMDDGTLTKRKGKSPTAVFCTDGFSESDNLLIKEFLSEKYGIDSCVDHRNRIRLTVDGSKKLFSLISKYMLEMFYYKLPAESVPDQFVEIDNTFRGYAAKFVEKVEYVDCSSDLFDIEIEETHNFVADKIVVHNCHGIGACNARKILRHPSMLYARDIPELKDMLCDVPAEIMARLDRGESGFGELAQGFTLSLNHQKFLGYTTSRNVTVAHFMSDLFLPTKYAGNVIINHRTYPIRINSNKYISKDGRHLTWSEVQSGVEHTTIHGDSGPWYDDQKEISWEELSERARSKETIMECTSVTKLPRRVATFSKQCLRESIVYNDTGHRKFVTLNFADYINSSLAGATEPTKELIKWMEDNVADVVFDTEAELLLVGTGPNTEDVIFG